MRFMLTIKITKPWRGQNRASIMRVAAQRMLLMLLPVEPAHIDRSHASAAMASITALSFQYPCYWSSTSEALAYYCLLYIHTTHIHYFLLLRRFYQLRLGHSIYSLLQRSLVFAIRLTVWCFCCYWFWTRFSNVFRLATPNGAMARRAAATCCRHLLLLLFS